MANQRTTLERAFELARSGQYSGIGEIRLKLKGERFLDVDQQLFGKALQQQLKRICEEARRTQSSVEVDDPGADHGT